MRSIVILAVLLAQLNVILGGVIVSSTGMVRSSEGDTATFYWTLTRASVDYNVHNLTTGIPMNLSSRARCVLDSIHSGIQLTIVDIGLWDAGNYSLSVSYDNTTEENSDALLFVFGHSSTSIYQTAGPAPPTEGHPVEISCVVTSSSLPVAYQPAIYTSWHLRGHGYPTILSNSSLWTQNGILSRYTVKNGNGILVIDPLEYEDMQDIGCNAYEIGSPYADSKFVYFTHLNNMQYKPRQIKSDPPSQRFNAYQGESVVLRILSYNSNPSLLPLETNWTIIDNNGSLLDLPQNAIVGSYKSPYLQFILPSTMYHGSYICTLTNAVGNTTITFSVAAPGAPDPPMFFQVVYATHYSVYLQWKCMWSNYRFGSQDIYTVLKTVGTNTTVGVYTISPTDISFNSTWAVEFANNITPDTEYLATVNSTNDLGTSETVTLSLRTAKPPRLFVSSDTILVDYPLVSVNFSLKNEDFNQFYVEIRCSVEVTGQSITTIIWNTKQSTEVINIGHIGNRTEYVFDITLYNYYNNYGGVPQTAIKGVRVPSTNSDN